MINSACRRVQDFLECVSRNNAAKPPMLSNVIFAGACYTLAYPALRRIFRRRFRKRLLKFLVVGVSVGALGALLMFLMAAQTKFELCRLLNSKSLKRSEVLKNVVYIVCFNVMCTFMRASLMKLGYRVYKEYRRNTDVGIEEPIVIKEEPKQTRSGTLY